MNDKEHFTWIADPGHAWLRVPHKLVRDLGIADKISSYSFHDYVFVTEPDGYMHMVHYAFLEEDCDAGVFAKAMRDAGMEWDADEKYVARFDQRFEMRRFGELTNVED